MTRAWWRHRSAVIGAGVLLALVVFVSVGPLLWSLPPEAMNFGARDAPASWAHPMGTDQLGRDGLSLLMAGGRLTLSVGLAAMLVSVLLGVVIGGLAGLVRWLDGPLMRLTDLVLSLPLLPLLLVAVMLFRDALNGAVGSGAGMFLLVVLAIGLTSWMATARVVRASVLSLRERDFVTAARSTGTPPLTLFTRHILPNCAAPILVSASLGMANAVITESALSYLGLGFPPDFISWGRMLSDGAPYLGDTPSRVLWPGVMISATVLSVTYLGDGLRDMLERR